MEHDNPHALNLFFTGKCNLACAYCFVNKDGQEKKTLDEKALKKSVDTLFGYKGASKTISFNGGEPLVEWPLVKKICLYAEKEAMKKKYDLNLVMVTNGTLLRQEVIDFAVLHKLSLRVSIDGKKTTHDKQRPFLKNKAVSTHDLVFENMRRLAWDGAQVTASMVFAPDSVEKLLDNIKFLNAQGFSRIDFYPDIYAHWTRSDLLKLKKAFKQFAEYYLEAFKWRKGIFKNSLLDSVVNGLKTDKAANCFNIQVDAEGDFYVCDKVVSLGAELRDKYKIGDVVQGIDDGKRALLLTGLRQRFAEKSGLKCEDCKYRKYCFCPIGQYIHYENNQNTPATFWKSFCQVSRVVTQTHLELARKLEYDENFIRLYRF